MANTIYDFLVSESSSSATGGVNTAEGQDPSTVNDAMRQWKQLEAAFLDDLHGVNTVTGTGDAVAVTLAQGFNGYGSSAGQIMTGVGIRLIAPGTNTGAATINVNTIGTKKIRKMVANVETALSAGDIVQGDTLLLIYRSTADTGTGAWILIGSAPVAAATTSASGIVQLATLTEAATLTNATKAVTPSDLTFLAGYAATATAAGTTTLTVTDVYNQYFTGSTTQTVVLPVTSTLVLGRSFRIVNNSTGVVTVQSSGANTIKAMGGTLNTLAPGAPGTELIVTCILTSGTGTASWDYEYRTPTTDWVAFTPVGTGFGTLANVSFFSKRVGDTLHIQGKFTTGTPTAVECRMTIGFNGTSANVTSDATKVPSIRVAGYGATDAAATQIYYALIETSVTYLTFGLQFSGGGGLTKQTGSSMIGSTVAFSFKAEIPLAGG